MLADVITFVYEVPFIFWHYINVDGVSWITLKKLLQSAMELLQIATAFLLQSATRFITNCDRYYKVRWIYYKLRQVLQSAMITTNCDSTYVFLVYYKVGWTVITNCDSFFITNCDSTYVIWASETTSLWFFLIFCFILGAAYSRLRCKVP